MYTFKVLNITRKKIPDGFVYVPSNVIHTISCAIHLEIDIDLSSAGSGYFFNEYSLSSFGISACNFLCPQNAARMIPLVASSILEKNG